VNERTERMDRTGGGDRTCCGSNLMVMGGPINTSEDVSRVIQTLAVPRERSGHGGNEQRKAE